MKNKHEKMKEAEAFSRENCAYLHIEVKDGKHEGTVMAGDCAGLMNCLLSVLRRLEKLTDIPVSEHLKILGEMYAQAFNDEKSKRS